MNFKKEILKTFERKKHKIVWQPRIYYWFYGNGLKNRLPEGYNDITVLYGMYWNIPYYGGDIPEKYVNKSMLEIYDDLNASPRYPEEVLGVRLFRLKLDTDNVKCITKLENEKIITKYKTPKGTLREVRKRGYHLEYPVKSIEDIKIARYILKNLEFEFDKDAFEIAKREFGNRGVIQSYYPRSPFQRLLIDYMGFENTIYALNDHPNEIEGFMDAIDEWDDEMYKVILKSPLKILNFGENIDGNIDSPTIFERYLIPYYKKRIKQIHHKGKFCHIHMDGSLKPILPYLKELEFDGIEAATPLPQGDVSLEELKEALGDKILLDGIPAILFLPEHSEEELKDFATKVLELFSPNLILGISDELPPPAEIERVNLVSKIVDDYNNG